MVPPQQPTLDDLREVIQTCPVIDNHAHNLLLPDQLSSYNFETITTEAHGDALEDTFSSLPHYRAARQLRELYALPEDSNWEAILAKRQELLAEDPDGLFRKCLEGTHCILMDDGLDANIVHEYSWHDRYTTSPTKRIVRIEREAENILRAMSPDNSNPVVDWWDEFSVKFEETVRDCLEDPEVVGFKSVVCYRTGLDVSVEVEESVVYADSVEGFPAWLEESKMGKYRLQHKTLNDWLVCKTLELITQANGVKKPIQFHTGLGDNDISLLRANPAYMQPLIEHYPQVPIIILHSSYPYTREAGYLASVFKNAYLDIGEVFPMLSRDGQIGVIRQSMEMTPTSKLLWSTDGHWFPETYWLGNVQFRECLESVLFEYASQKDITIAQAIKFVKDIFFNNANNVYQLGLDLPAAGSLVTYTSSSKSLDPGLIKLEGLEKQGVEYIYVQWLDYMGTKRVRVWPIAKFSHLVRSGRRIGIARANTSTLQNDTVNPAVNTTGMFYAEPDLSTLRVTHPDDPLRSASVLAWWRDDKGKPFPECPRSTLSRLLQELKSEYGITMRAGFEIEVVFLKRRESSSDDKEPYLGATENQSWGALTPSIAHIALPLLDKIVKALRTIGVEVEQFHAESGSGQFEFVLPHAEPLEAIDTLVQIRTVITDLAHQAGYRATLHPKPLGLIGSGAHVHFSFKAPATRSKDGDMPQALPSHEAKFLAGLLSHLRSICAFSLAEPESYERAIDDGWAGGTWVAWGTENRETSLRRVEADGGRWEFRSLDGFANNHLVFSAIVAAGLDGLRREMELNVKDCEHNPARLNDEGRQQYGIQEQLPRNLEDALSALENDQRLKEIMTEVVVNNYIVMKRAEQEMLSKLNKVERKIWLIERY